MVRISHGDDADAVLPCTGDRLARRDAGQHLSDAVMAIDHGECIGVCEGAPAVLLNDEARPDVTPDKVDALLEELRRR